MNELAVIVPTIGRLFNLGWLESCAKEHKVIVVCDGGYSFSHPQISNVIAVKNGFSSAVNTGIQQAQREGYRYALVLNDDAFPEADCVSTLLSVAAGRDIVLSPVIVEGGHELYGYSRSCLGHMKANYQSKEFSFLSAVCLLIPTWARFDENYIHGFEDFELCRRLNRSGLEIHMVSGARCRHIGGASVERTSAKAQYGSAYGQLRFEGLRFVPMVLAFQIGQVIVEGV